MDTILKISGFKCFEEDAFVLKKITVLTGSNGTGKSSLIQAILLTRLAIEKNLKSNIQGDYSLSESWGNLSTPLNNGYQLKLGTIYDIMRENENSKNEIFISLNDEVYKFGIPDNIEDDTSIKAEIFEKNDSTLIPFWRKKEFYYLHTERLGPRHLLNINSIEFIHCGFQGEYTAQVILKYGEKVGFASAMIQPKTNLLLLLVNHWLDTICPGVSISAVPSGDMGVQIRVTGTSNKSSMLATNIGFGVSYALPIIVTGLIAKSGSVLIVENPEAHLHPKGQSNIGFFLGKVAEAGVKVIIETHSEHVVNGIRRAALSSGTMNANDTNIYFFHGFDSMQKLKVKLIEIEGDGSLSQFPKDFFDQVNQDLGAMFKLTQNESNGKSNDL